MNAKTLLTLAMFLFAGALPAAASDLAEDLLTPFEPVTNPFTKDAETPLAPDLAQPLKLLLERCAYTPVVRQDGRFDTELDAELRPECRSQLSASYVLGKNGRTHIGNRLAIHFGRVHLQLVAWDGSESDGGDQQALGVYDLAGNRLAVYPGLFAEGNVVDALAHALGAQLAKSAR